MCNTPNKEKRVFGKLVLGSLIGAGIFFFWKTEKGKRIQKILRKKGKIAISQLKNILDELEDKSKEFKEKAEEIAEGIKETTESKLSDISETAKEQIGQHLDTAFEKISDLQEKGKELTHGLHADLKKKFFRNLPKKVAE